MSEPGAMPGDGAGSTLRPVDLVAVERELCRIPEVRAARIVAGDDGRPVEVHILASTAKGAKQLVRDVQSVAIAASGVDIDHRIVSVVQLDDAEPGELRADPPPNGNGATTTASKRIVVDSVIVKKQELRCNATVTLQRGDEQAVGSADGSVASSARWRIVAEASLNALRLFETGATNVTIEMAGVQRVGDRALGIVTLILLLPPNEELLAGVAPVRGGSEEEAVARAVLDATNRRLARLR
jgi:hypothetical protein